jgi:5'-phosphate synthase pdxT subunit
MSKTVAVLALQGAFREHEQTLAKLGVSTIQIRQAADLNQAFDGLVLPGGESTAQAKLLHELGIFATLQERIRAGLPVLATCAGLILLSAQLKDEDGANAQPQARFATLDVTTQRNAYGRQLGSFHTEAPVAGIGTVPMTFIRAPYVTHAEPAVEILARVENRIVAVRQDNQLALAFHPELDANTAIHEAFVSTL